MTENYQLDREVTFKEILAENEDLKTHLKQSQRAVQDLKEQIAVYEKESAEAAKKYAETVYELELAKLIVDQSPVVLFRRRAGKIGDKPTIEYISDNLIQFGYEPKELMEDKIRFKDIVHPDDRERLLAEINRYVDDDVEEYTQYYRALTKTGDARWVEDQTSIVRDDEGNKIHNQGILIDITERKLAEEKVKRSEEKFRRIVETAPEGFLLMDETFTIVDTNDAYCSLVNYKREELLGKNLLDHLSDDFRNFILATSETTQAQENRALEGSLVAKSGHVIPILFHGTALRDDQGSIIGNMAFITDMTQHKKALELAGEVQRGLLPDRPPIVPGVEIAGRNIPCDEVGGDYFDYLWDENSGENRLSIVVGDITGHGVDAALLMSSARAFLRMRASHIGTPLEIVTAMNQHLTTDLSESGRFMTLFYLALDRQSEQLEWIRAGHDPALIYDPEEDSFEELMGPGLALGVVEDFEYEPQRRNGLKPGQVIVIGTDGIWESCNPSGEMFGRQRLMEIVRETAAQDANMILEKVFQEHADFSDGLKSEDDLTLVVVKIHAQ